MEPVPSAYLSDNVVLVADVISASNVAPPGIRRDLERTDQQTIEALIDTIRGLGRKVTHYRWPDELARQAAAHKNDIILSIFGGEKSRNRMALVPAICEAFGLRFIGPDVYGRIIAQDKEVSKRLAVDCDLHTPSWRIVRGLKDLNVLQNIQYPCIIKPLLEGSSIGITQENLTRSPAEAENVVRRLISDVGPPLILEDFVLGRETAFVAIEQQNTINWAYSEVVVKGQPDFFNEFLFDADEKMNPTTGRTVRNIDNELSSDDRQAIERFLSAFGRFGYCRVDGRHAEGRFHFLELTPDAWIDPKGQFAMAFTKKGWSYSDVIAAVLSSEG